MYMYTYDFKLPPSINRKGVENFIETLDDINTSASMIDGEEYNTLSFVFTYDPSPQMLFNLALQLGVDVMQQVIKEHYDNEQQR